MVRRNYLLFTELRISGNCSTRFFTRDYLEERHNLQAYKIVSRENK